MSQAMNSIPMFDNQVLMDQQEFTKGDLHGNQQAMKYIKIAQIESIFVRYPLLDELVQDINHCRTHSKIAAEPECMFVGGAAGAGKTTLQLHYKRLIPSVTVDDRVTIPVLRVRVPAKATEKTLVTALLRSIGDPLAELGSADKQKARLLGLMNDFKVELVEIDEFQQFVDRDNSRVQQKACDWLKGLIEDSGRPFLLCGMPWAVHILEDPMNEQLGRRIAIRKELTPFGWNTEEEKKLFRAFLKKIEARLQLPDRSRLGSSEMAFRFFCATNGRIGKIMKVVRRAAELVILKDMQCLDLDVLARAYNERLMVDQPDRINPFSSDYQNLKPIPYKEYAPDFNKTNGRSKATGKTETASKILHK